MSQLFHFTREDCLSSILNRGLKLGQIRLNSSQAISVVSLTKDGEAENQVWAENPFNSEIYGCDFRLSVTPPNDAQVYSWAKFYEELQVGKTEHSELLQLMEWNPENWNFYLEDIPPRAIEKVWSIEENRYLREAELQRVKQEFPPEQSAQTEK